MTTVTETKGDVAAWMLKYRIFSRSMLVSSFILMVWITVWGTQFASTSSLSGTEIAAVLAAAQIPATALFGSIYRVYKENIP